MLNRTRPRPSLRASGTLPSEAIQWEGRLVWIASPCGFAMTWGRLLNSFRPKRRALWYCYPRRLPPAQQIKIFCLRIAPDGGGFSRMIPRSIRENPWTFLFFLLTLLTGGSPPLPST
ncbi:MAG: hypothetical protein LBT00_07195 [Spirochaetaceae bacterium]|nr:hypothetical protein [Spirochaetaceae bacterium]